MFVSAMLISGQSLLFYEQYVERKEELAPLLVQLAEVAKVNRVTSGSSLACLMYPDGWVWLTAFDALLV